MKARPILVRIALVLGGSFLTLIALEFGLRILIEDPRGAAFPGNLVTADAQLGWRLTPQINAVHATPHFEVTYTTNDLGHRDRQRSPDLRQGWRRVLLYGNSQVFGWGVPAGRRFSDLIESRAADLEVWNLAVPGYGLEQQVLAYAANDYEAHTAAFLVSRATLHRLRYDYLFGLAKPVAVVDSADKLVVTEPRAEFPRSLVHSLPRWAYLPYWIEQRLQGVELSGARDTQATATALLRYAADLAASRHQRVLALLHLPPSERVAFEALAAKLEITVVAIDPGGIDTLVALEDTHWNSRGHARVARFLAPILDPAETP